MPLTPIDDPCSAPSQIALTVSGAAPRVRRALYRLGKGVRALRVGAALEHGFLHRLGINVTFEVLFAPYSLRSTFAHLAVAGFNGITSVKWVPMADFGRVSSAPNCFESALTRRAPSRLLVVGSKPRGRPTPSSQTDTKIEFSSD